MRKLQLQNHKFGELVVIKENGKTPRGNFKWLCICSCGKKITVIGGKLTSGYTKSCGCLRRGHDGICRICGKKKSKKNFSLTGNGKGNRRHICIKCYSKRYGRQARENWKLRRLRNKEFDKRMKR